LVIAGEVECKKIKKNGKAVTITSFENNSKQALRK
jgi:hypothetical protein